MTRTRRAAGAASLVLALVSDNEAREQRPITGDTAAAVQAWVDAVRSHVPGRADEPVMVVAAYSYETREELDAGLGFFLAALLGRQYDTKNNPAARTIVGIGRSAGSPDDVSFLKRAAVFHADVAAYGERAPAPSAAGTKAPAGRETAPVSPLLTKNRLVLTKDGQVLGEMPASWNWPFARSLLERLARQRDGTSRDPFVALWYHATSAHMFDSGAYGDLTPHLEDAGTVLRDDPWMLFDRGCYAELLGLPLLQAVLPDSHVMDEKLRRDRAAGGMSTWRTPASSASLGIPPANETNNEAERLFRRAVTLDPSLDEARVRLARLLILRNRHKEALAELTAALTRHPPPALSRCAAPLENCARSGSTRTRRGWECRRHRQRSRCACDRSCRRGRSPRANRRLDRYESRRHFITSRGVAPRMAAGRQEPRPGGLPGTCVRAHSLVGRAANPMRIAPATRRGSR